jgi:hypothetical protein
MLVKLTLFSMPSKNYGWAGLHGFLVQVVVATALGRDITT